MRRSSLLLETTIQLYRVAYSPEAQQAIEAELQGKTIYTTSFVFREFLRTIIQDIAFVHHIAQNVKRMDTQISLGNLQRSLAMAPVFSVRSVKRLQLIMGKVLDEFPNTAISREQLLIKLERIGQQWIRDFFRVVNAEGESEPILCLTSLDRSEEELGQMQQGEPFPPPPLFPVRAAEFLDQHKQEVETVERAMQAALLREGKDPTLLKILALLKKGKITLLLKNSSRIQGETGIWETCLSLWNSGKKIRRYPRISPSIAPTDTIRSFAER